MKTRVRSLTTVTAASAALAISLSTAPAEASTAAPSTSAAPVAATAIVQQPLPIQQPQPLHQLLPWPTLYEGHNGNLNPAVIRSLQYLLNAHGARLAADGQFGPRTEAALRAFQRSTGIEPTGVVYAGTWLKLITTLREGSQGSAVRALQTMLNFQRNGAFGSFRMQFALAVDGMFGPKTAASVWAFQRAVANQVRGFPVDGIVGPRTWQALETFLD